jgi:hypothetical protein
MSRYQLLFCFFLACCSSKKTSNCTFYYWKTHFELSQEEKKALAELEVKKIYVKFFDIDWSAEQQAAIPLATVTFDTSKIDLQNIIPTVFITNRTFSNLAPNDIVDLAQKTSQKIANMAFQSYSEIQLDCDWTAETQTLFFSFIRELKKLNPQQSVTCTIRLHQVKYAKQTGIPPCDRGVLMLYNTGDLDNQQEQNSIFDAEIAKRYLSDWEQYPLKLDVALAIFQWGVVQRNTQTIKLIHALSEKALDSVRFLKQDATHFEVLTSTYLEGYYLYAGDKIRLEKARPEDLSNIVAFIAQHHPSSNYTIFFYHLDQKNISNYGLPFLKRLLY